MKKSFKIIYYIFVGLLALIAILLIISAFPITGNFKVMTVLSGSMEPAIHTGSVVAVKPVPSTGSGQAADYKIGDVITFGPYSKTQAPVTHRIAEIKVVGGQSVFITKGDANDSPDSKEVQESEIIGKVLFSAPYVGYAVDFAKKPFGFMLIIVVPAVIIIYDEFRKIWGEIKRIKGNKKNKDKEQDDKIDKLEDEVKDLKD